MSKLFELREPAAPARLAATLTILIGLISIGGWLFGAQVLTSVIPGAVSMKLNTALALAGCGIALALLAERISARVDRAAQALGLLAALLGLLTLLEYLLGWDLKIDQLLIDDHTEAYNVFRGRMSPMSAAAFVAAGAALAAMPHAGLKVVRKLGAALILTLASVSLLGYLWRAGEMVTDKLLPPVAINTASCFLLLGVGILLSPRGADRPLAERLGSMPAVEIQTLVGFCIAFSLLIIGGGYTYRTNVEFSNSVQWISHTQDVRAALAAANGALAAAELAERDYLLTTDPAHLADCGRLVGDIESQLANLVHLTSDNPVQRHNLAILKDLIEARLKDIETALDAFASNGLPAARTYLARTRNVDVTRRVPLEIARMDALEAGYLRDRETSSAHVRHSTFVSLLVTLLAAAATFAALFLRIHREMLARRSAERALGGSEQYNRSIVDSSPDCLGVLGLDARIDEMTPQGLRLMEVDDFSAIARGSWLDWWTGADRAAAKEALAAARGGDAGRFQGFCATHKGTPKWWDVIVMPIVGTDGRPERLLAVARDVSEVKRAEDHLLETNRFLDSLIDNLPVMVVLKDAATLRYVRHNRAFERLLGYTRDELIGKTAAGLSSPGEADFIGAKDREVLDTGRLLELEESISTPHGVRTFHTMKVPVGKQHGKPQFLLAIAVDITERKLAETAIVELNAALSANAEQLKATNKELESFSYSVSHDLRAPLRAIDGFAMMIEEDCAPRLDDEGRRYLSVIRENSKRMGALIDDLLAFSRLGRLPVATREVDVDSLVREVVAEVLEPHGAARPQIELGTLPPVHADPGLLRQVWANLLANAVKYSSKAAQPRIEVSGRRDGAENCYSVRDNGVGFNMAYADKLFGVFQRLHRAEEFTGTGVGLAIVHRVITRHGGRVWAEGEVDRGAVFSFALPAGGCIGHA
jgi:PAS domain S-box-containing protein